MEKVYPLLCADSVNVFRPAFLLCQPTFGGPGPLLSLDMYETNMSDIDIEKPTEASPALASASVRFQAIREHLFSLLSNEAVILSLKNGKYYTLNSVGSSIWGIIKEPANFSDIESAILEEYDVDPSTCRKEIELFLDKMVAEELVVLIDG